MVYVAFKPLDKTNPNQIQPQQKIDIPSYPDKGTTFAGYSKTLYSGNTYQLNPQESQDVSWFTTYAGGETGSYLTNPFTPSKDFYVKKIVLYLYHTLGGTAGSRIQISSGNMNKIVLMENISLQYNSYDINFDVPVLFKKDVNMGIFYDTPRVANDRIIMNMFGWTE